jgi:hypothetical protein
VRVVRVARSAKDATAAIEATAATIHAMRAGRVASTVVARPVTGETAPVLPPIQRSSRARSPALCHRSSGFLASQLVTTRSSDAGVVGIS